MRKTILFVLFIISLFITSCTINDSKQNESLTVKETFEEAKVDRIYEFNEEIISGINEIGFDILNMLYEKDNNANILFSPVSLTSALSMLENGVDGDTKSEILSVMNIENDDNLNETYNHLINYYNQVSNSEFENKSTIYMANSFWFKNMDLIVKEGYLKTVKSSYDGDIFSVDFKDIKTKNDINKWIEDKTNGLLKDTLKEIDSDVIAYLINTLYFNGTWRNEFDKELTQKADFNLSDGDTVKVDMMHQVERNNYYEDENVQMVSLNYSDVSMKVILPKTSINQFLKNDNNELLKTIDKSNEYKLVNLYFPKFKYDSNNDLKDILKVLGMTSAFEFDTAEFDSMMETTNDTRVKVSKVFQNTTIEVDEEGTEAAAVTVIEMVEESCPDKPNEPILMNCNKPFVFIIKDNKSNSNLFVGIVQNPAK